MFGEPPLDVLQGAQVVPFSTRGNVADSRIGLASASKKTWLRRKLQATGAPVGSEAESVDRWQFHHRFAHSALPC